MRLLLLLPLTAHIVDGRPHVDLQACNGLRLWLANFDTVTLACRATNQSPSGEFGPIDEIPGGERLTFVPLPIAYTPNRFALALPGTARLLRHYISQADYLHFAIGGLWGDWASLACLLTNRPYAVWTDRVEYRVAMFSASSKSGVRRLYTLATAHLMKRYERLVIRRSALGLFHGGDCFEAYAKYCRNPQLVHNIHVGSGNVIDLAALRQRSSQAGPLRIAYAGRVHRDKGVFDWIEALSRLDAPFEATWFGDGPELARARQLAPPNVSFPGRAAARHRNARTQGFRCLPVLPQDTGKPALSD
jgi:colanic acid/amylovoran biosynthesis glycosyltransferase